MPWAGAVRLQGRQRSGPYHVEAACRRGPFLPPGNTRSLWGCPGVRGLRGVLAESQHAHPQLPEGVVSKDGQALRVSSCPEMGNGIFLGHCRTVTKPGTDGDQAPWPLRQGWPMDRARWPRPWAQTRQLSEMETQAWLVTKKKEAQKQLQRFLLPCLG